MEQQILEDSMDGYIEPESWVMDPTTHKLWLMHTRMFGNIDHGSDSPPGTWTVVDPAGERLIVKQQDFILQWHPPEGFVLTEAQEKAIFEAFEAEIENHIDDELETDELSGYMLGVCHTLQILMSPPDKLNDPNYESPYVQFADTLYSHMVYYLETRKEASNG